MSNIFKTEERRVIPRLRSFEIASITGEMAPYDKVAINFKSQEANLFLQEQLAGWSNNKSIVNAGDILSSAFVLGEEDSFKEIASYILDNSINESPLNKLATKIIAKGQIIGTSELDSAISSVVDIDFEIRVLKNALGRQPKNPIAWMEIGRLYALKGQLKKANRAIENALILDKDNRFIVRSASRFYHHFVDTEKALFTIRNSEYYKNDPWLLSAEIAYSQILKRFSRMVKQGENIVKSNLTDKLSVTELTSALGTFEFIEGNSKAAKKYFQQTLIDPNDNSLAQVNWIAENMKGFNVDTLSYELPLAFEAKSIYYSEKGMFDESYSEAMRWHDDEPYSVRPIKVASYIQGFYYKDFNKSIELTERGLRTAPNDILLNNNLIYYLTRDGQLERAVKLFDSHLKKVIQNPQQYRPGEQIFCFATAGLMFYSQNMPDVGENFYLKAIDLARKERNFYFLALATIHYSREELLFADADKSDKILKQLKETCKNNQEQDVKFMLNELILSQAPNI